MSKRRVMVPWVLGAAIAAYALIASTPMKSFVGRYNPRAASIFSPLLFNFSHTYMNGRVLNFTIGMTRQDFLETLQREYAGKGDITVNCKVTTADSVVPITTELEIGSIYGGGERLCARLDSRKLGIVAYFDKDLVSAVNLWFVRSEFP